MGETQVEHGPGTEPGNLWLLPSAVRASLEPETRAKGGARGRRPQRTVRDWLVDFTVFFLAVGLGLVAADGVTGNAHISEGQAELDQVLGALSCAAVWIRRRAPLGLAVAMIPVGLLSDTASGTVVLSLFTLAVHRPFKYVAWVGGASMLLTPIIYVLRPPPDVSFWAGVAISLLIAAGVIGWGMFARSRRLLLGYLRERAQRAETEAALRADRAQRLAREDMAREMHDVLAHRLTLLSVHAGALEFRPDAPPPEIQRAAGVIRDSAHDALQDLRQIIGVLRASGQDESGGRPQPTLDALERLVEESRSGGMKVLLDNRVTDPSEVPAALGRNAYRIAQEALTNARKHAPGAEVSVRVSGAPGAELGIEVTHPAPPGEVTPVPGSGQGLIGLTERASLVGGRLDHGRTGDGGFRVAAWLPWPS
ncbi:sensor histidine kinase [Streptomyces tsukubensis]|uniref:histidine kinase n=1 Tax=Streptomyces tsukubensis TaxID=83656 RepID=A0A1V4ADM1_9ACTN|nr:histidine kinase [Streptomyces tsukubensis]OON81655.1 sensor histidine kinase [Streptomyces tsukubensis]QFR96430.1 sensor histidine kinase [Streptomyces tsukubensis]